jgi:hypothetical protein
VLSSSPPELRHGDKQIIAGDEILPDVESIHFGLSQGAYVLPHLRPLVPAFGAEEHNDVRVETCLILMGHQFFHCAR